MQTKSFLTWLHKYLRYVDYIGAAQLYLRDNFLLKEKLKPEHIKARILGHWGTVPGLNFIYANLNYLVYKHACNLLLIVGPGHGAPAVLANLFAEKTLNDFYHEYPLNKKGMGKLIKDFSWPHSRFPSHVTPTVPGSILEGGELGYSLATAFGAVFDNPDLIAAVVVGDGEAETGPIAASWHSNKFLNPRTSGAVLPIVHVNGYKISNPTLFGTMSDKELNDLFRGYGYEPFIVKDPHIEHKMLDTMETAYKKIRAIQKRARSGKKTFQPAWPVIILRSTKGWKGIHRFGGHAIEGSFRSHGVPLEPLHEKHGIEALAKWLKSYKINQLVDEIGSPRREVLAYVPKGRFRIGMNRHAIGGNIMKKLRLPALSNYAVKFAVRGGTESNSMIQSGEFLKDVFKLNKNNFRLFCPDEIDSNKLSGIFKATKRAYLWPVQKAAENISPDGRAMEILSEHTLQGWLQGYLLTGRHGILVSYEAFATIISSMVDQYAKFLKQSFRVPWRTPIASAIYILSSVGWRQDHNGYSHQNPSFVSSVLQKHGEFCQIYYPADVNSTLAAFEETLKRKNAICIIVADKRPIPQWLTLEEARKQAKTGMGVWQWVTGKQASANPDVVAASAGDYITQETLVAIQMCRQLAPGIKIRYVNVSELTSLCLGDYCPTKSCHATEKQLEKYFTATKPVVFNYHGYVNDIEQILWPYTTSHRFSLHGYREEGSTTTPFDLKIANGVSCYHIAIDIIQQAAKHNKTIARKKTRLIATLQAKIAAHQKYIEAHGDDPPEVKNILLTFDI